MEPLDLSIAPPRAPREHLDGIVFLPRSIDKVRATLPGGNPGAYAVAGFTQIMIEGLGMSVQAFTDTVANAASDEAVAAFVLKASTQAQRDEWNDYAAKRLPRGGDRAAALQAYPWLSEYPELPLALDVLEEDDRRHFATSEGSL